MKPALFAPLLLAFSTFGQTPPDVPFPSALRDYFSLTDTQVRSVNSLNAAYAQFYVGKQQRIGQIQADIVDKTNADPIDPMALGLRYAEVEAINRDLRDKVAQLRSDLANLLTAAQTPKLKVLGDAQKLQPMVSLAQCYNFLAPSPTVAVITGVISPTPVPGLGVSSGAIGLPTPCYVGPAPSPFYVTVFPGALTDFLALTDSQVNSAGQLTAAYAYFYEEKQLRIAQVRGDIADKTGADMIDPLALGLDYAEIEAINRDLRDKLAGLRSDLAKLLTPAQQAKAKSLDDARQLQNIVSQAQCENLLAPLSVQFTSPVPAFRTGDFTTISGNPNFCGY